MTVSILAPTCVGTPDGPNVNDLVMVTRGGSTRPGVVEAIIPGAAGMPDLYEIGLHGLPSVLATADELRPVEHTPAAGQQWQHKHNPTVSVTVVGVERYGLVAYCVVPWGDIIPMPVLGAYELIEETNR